MLTSSGNTLTDTPRNHVYADISISHGPVKLTHKIKSQDTLNGCWGVESGVGHLAALNRFALLHDFLFYSLADTFEVQGFGLSLFPWLLAFSFLSFFFFFLNQLLQPLGEVGSMGFHEPSWLWNLCLLLEPCRHVWLAFSCPNFSPTSSYYSSLRSRLSDIFIYF